jgi:hypothetical protein
MDVKEMQQKKLLNKERKRLHTLFKSETNELYKICQYKMI